MSQNSASYLSYLQKFVGKIGLNEPVIESDVEELILRSLSETQHLLELCEQSVLLLFIHLQLLKTLSFIEVKGENKIKEILDEKRKFKKTNKHFALASKWNKSNKLKY